MKDQSFDPYSDVMKFLRWAFVVPVVATLMTVFYRYAAAARPQPISIIKLNESGGIASMGPTIFVPGGFDRFLTDGGGYAIYIHVGALASFLVVIYSITCFHRLADLAAFMVVSSDKVAAMRRRLQMAYGCMIGAFTVAALSFVFDSALTLSVWIGHKAGFMEGMLTWVSEHYPWVFVGGVLVSVAMGLWWAMTLEYPRDVSFQGSD